MNALRHGLPTVAVLLLLAWAPAVAHAGGPGMLVGATEDAVKSTDPATAKSQMDLLAMAGFDAVRITQDWAPGQTAITSDQATILDNVLTAAKADGVVVFVTVMNYGSATTPLTATDQADFASFAASVASTAGVRHIIVGNEPNLNRYWLPQFNPDGSDAAAPAYESLLAQTYDAVKAAAPGVQVIGGALSPRGGDADGIRPTHSPTQFILDMGTAYKASGRATPIMDALSLHPYEDHSDVAPAAGTHPNTTTIALADYGKLVSLLGQAFDGTAQQGSALPIYFDEFGVETQIPAAKASVYTGTEPAVTHPVDEATQGAYYKQAIQLAFCQPTVRGFFVFHAFDEKDLAGWQSGVYYADDTPKASLEIVKAAIALSRRGVVAACPGLALTPKPVVAQQGPVLTLRCDIDCAYVAQLYRLPGKLLASKRGRAVGDRPTTLRLQVPSTPGSYRLRLSATATVNVGKPALIRVPVRPG